MDPYNDQWKECTAIIFGRRISHNVFGILLNMYNSSEKGGGTKAECPKMIKCHQGKIYVREGRNNLVGVQDRPPSPPPMVTRIPKKLDIQDVAALEFNR